MLFYQCLLRGVEVCLGCRALLKEELWRYAEPGRVDELFDCLVEKGLI